MTMLRFRGRGIMGRMRRLSWLLCACLLASCGSVRATADAGPDDPDGGGGDPVDGGGGEPDGSVAPGVVTVTVYQNGDLAAGVDVVFMDANGDLVAQEQTDGNGIATAEVEAGADVHILMQPGVRDYEAVTILDIAPGDDLVVGTQEGFSDVIVGSVNVTLPPGALPAGVNDILVEVGCTSNFVAAGTTSTTIQLYESCVREGNIVSVVATGRDSSFEAVVYAAAADVALTGSPLTANVTLPAWRMDFVDRNIIVNNAPLDLLGFELDAEIRAHGHRFDVFGPTNDAPPPPGGSGSYDLWFAPGIADTESFTIFGLRGNDIQRGASVYLRGAPMLPATTTLDLGEAFMPLVHSSQWLDGDVIWDTEGDVASQSDAVAFQVSWSEITGGQDFSFRWTLLGPPDLAPPFALPQLPAGFTDWAPDATSNLNMPQVIFLDIVGYDGYDEYRRGLGASIFGGGFPPTVELRASFAGEF